MVVFEAQPDPGYAFQNWSGDLSGDVSGQLLLIDGNKSVIAQFAPTNYTIDISTEGNGNIILDPDQSTYDYGEVVQVTAVAASEWRLAEWGLDLTGAETVKTLTVTRNTSIVAIFEPATYSLNVAWVGGGGVAKLPDKDEFAPGEAVTVTASVDEGYVFIGWSEEFSDTLFSESLTTVLTMNEDKSIVATFAVTPGLSSILSVTVVGQGAVAPLGGEFEVNEAIPLSATPAEGWDFVGWSGDLTGASNPISITMDTDKHITATFTTDLISTTLALSVTPSIPLEGQPVTFTASMTALGLARLAAASCPATGQVEFSTVAESLGQGMLDGECRAILTLNDGLSSGIYQVTAAFPGDDTYLASSTTIQVSVGEQDSSTAIFFPLLLGNMTTPGSHTPSGQESLYLPFVENLAEPSSRGTATRSAAPSNRRLFLPRLQ